jgi:hypothetical protein
LYLEVRGIVHYYLLIKAESAEEAEALAKETILDASLPQPRVQSTSAHPAVDNFWKVTVASENAIDGWLQVREDRQVEWQGARLVFWRRLSVTLT